MNILIIGGGGREHTIAWKLAQSPNCGKLFVAPGNAGTHEIATNLALDVTDFESIKQAVLDNSVQMVIVGQKTRWSTGFTISFWQMHNCKELP